MKRILFVSVAAPPKSGAESLQSAKYLAGLSKFFDIDLVTTTSSNYGWNQAQGKKEEVLLPYVDTLIELNGFTDRLSSKFKKILPAKIKFPDDDFQFHYLSRLVLSRLNVLPDLIYSRSSPISSSFMAYKLKKKLRKPWIMHLSDPWVDNPFLTTNIRKNVLLEKECIANADLITVTNENYRLLLKEKYPVHQDKFELCYNAYDHMAPNSISLKKRFKMIYFGNFYGDRSPNVLMEPLSLAYQQNLNAFDNVQVCLFGNIDEESRRLIDSFKLPFVHYKGHVPQAKIPDIVEDATMLVNIEDSFDYMKNILFLPSKIMDYISYQRPILSISSNRSPSKSIIDQNYGEVFDHHQKLELAEYILKAIAKHSEKDYEFFKITTPDPTFSIDYQVEQLKDKIRDLVN